MKSAVEMVIEDCAALCSLDYPGVPPIDFINSKQDEIQQHYDAGMRVHEISDLMISVYRLHRSITAH